MSRKRSVLHSSACSSPPPRGPDRDLLSTPIPPWDGRRREIFTFPRYVATGPIIPDTESLSEERPVRFRGNTVHLTSPPCYPVQNSNRRTGHGTHGGGTSEGGANHRLHQLGSAGQDLSQGEDSIRVVRHGENERSPARFAGPRGHLLRHRPGAVHAVFLPRGPAMPSGGVAVAARSVGQGQGGRQVRDLAGAHPAGMGAVAATA